MNRSFSIVEDKFKEIPKLIVTDFTPDGRFLIVPCKVAANVRNHNVIYEQCGDPVSILEFAAEDGFQFVSGTMLHKTCEACGVTTKGERRFVLVSKLFACNREQWSFDDEKVKRILSKLSTSVSKPKMQVRRANRKKRSSSSSNTSSSSSLSPAQSSSHIPHTRVTLFATMLHVKVIARMSI